MSHTLTAGQHLILLMGGEESFFCLRGMWGCSPFLPSTWEGDPDGLR